MKEREIVIETKQSYRYIIEGPGKLIVLKVEEEDTIVNADGEIDCPLESILRKNKLSRNDLLNWEIERIVFIEASEHNQRHIREINCAETLMTLKQKHIYFKKDTSFKNHNNIFEIINETGLFLLAMIVILNEI